MSVTPGDPVTCTPIRTQGQHLDAILGTLRNLSAIPLANAPVPSSVADVGDMSRRAGQDLAGRSGQLHTRHGSGCSDARGCLAVLVPCASPAMSLG